MSLDTIKKRIKTIKITSKITNAMKLIASAKIAKQKNAYLKIKDYYEEYYEIVGKILSMSQNDKVKTTQKTLHIVITSSLGLCGGYNINVIKSALEDIKSTDFVLQLGTRGKEYFRRKLSNDQIINFNPFKEDILYEDCVLVANHIIELLNKNQIDSVKIHYTKFVNAITFMPTSLNLIPFDDKLIGKDKAWQEKDFDFEPNKEQIILEILSTYLSSVIYGSMIESSISENASRRNAMDTATDNANELITNLQLTFNRLRQSKITNEITEIVSGSEEN